MLIVPDASLVTGGYDQYNPQSVGVVDSFYLVFPMGRRQLES